MYIRYCVILRLELIQVDISLRSMNFGAPVCEEGSNSLVMFVASATEKAQ